ncbi:hypothetical protein D3C76_1711430 [compost metagenome]
MLPVDRDRLKQCWYTGRSKHRFGADVLVREDAYLPRLDIGRAQVEVKRALRSQGGKIDLLLQYIAQRTQIAPIELVRREEAKRHVREGIHG